MGFTPREVDAMSVWEFTACCEGYSPDTKGGGHGDMDEDRARELGIEGF